MTGNDSAFQLTRSRGAWQALESLCLRRYSFQLTRSRGAWPALMSQVCYIPLHFNSHAHVERDIKNFAQCIVDTSISTHTLTWSVTVQKKPTAQHPQISTHTLTWSVTAYSFYRSAAWKDFNSHAHVERDQRGWHRWSNFCIFQLTRSRGAWHKTTLKGVAGKDFNSHAHVERDLPGDYQLLKNR